MSLTLATAQYPITEHKNWDEWVLHTEKWVAQAVQQNAQLLLFPEYGSMELVSIFSTQVRQDIRQQVIELSALQGDFCQVFENLARKYHVIIVAPSLPVIENGKPHNRAFVFSSKGRVGHQDKFFMTRFEDEEWGIQSAPKVLTLFEADWGCFGIQICYDVEFGIGSQLLSAAGASLILAPSCTETIRGATRVHVGARARALENQSYVVVSQTVGLAEWSPAVDINYGYTAMYCPPDKNLPEEGIVAQTPPQQAGWLVETLDFSLIEIVRTDGQVFNYQDHQRLHNQFISDEIKLIKRLI